MMELLAPCGNKEAFFTAVNCGADAVYLGLDDFSARKSAENFTAENLPYFVSYAHALGVKVYVALNTIVKNEEMLDFFDFFAKSLSAGADAVILQDVFLGKTLKTLYPSAELHLSTQAGINDLAGALYAKENGFSRVILSRETNIIEVEKIAKVIDTEVFVQGALCASFSGHCLMSSFIGGNSGNRGFCKQPCRQKYSLKCDYDGGEYPFSLSDLSLISRLDELKNAGVKSIKIEGRMRSPEYVYATVKAYRNALNNGKPSPYDLENLAKTFNRGNYTSGYVFGEDKFIVYSKTQGHIGYTVGTVLKTKGDELIIKENKKFLEKDAFKIVRNGFEVGNAIFLDGKIRFKGEAKSGDLLNITKDGKISEKLSAMAKRTKRITVDCKFTECETAKLSSEGITVTSEKPLEKAKSSSLTKEEIVKNLNKTDIYPFSAEIGSLELGDVFILKSELNKMRSALYEKLFYKDVKHYKNLYNTVDFKMFYDRASYSDIYFGRELSDEIKSSDAFVLFPENYDGINSEVVRRYKRAVKDVFLFVPAFLSEEECGYIEQKLTDFDGVYADGIVGLSIGKQLGKKIIAGGGLNVFNDADISALQREGVNDIVFSLEASETQLGEVGNAVYAFTSGAIRVMEFEFCPFKRDCKNCKRQDVTELKDDSGHKFYLLRYKLNGKCRFELYNGSALSLPARSHNFINNTLKWLDLPLTYGNYKRGIK